MRQFCTSLSSERSFSFPGWSFGAFLQPHYLSLGLLVPHFISLQLCRRGSTKRTKAIPQLNSGHKALKRDSGGCAKRVYMSHNVPVDILWP